MFSENPRDIAKADVDTVMFGWLATSPENFAAWKTELEQLCTLSGMCAAPVQAKIKQIFGQFDKINSKKERICLTRGGCPKTGKIIKRFIEVIVNAKGEQK